jgi:homoserine kinase type II
MKSTVHLLWFVKELDETEEELLIGVYSSDTEAKSAIERVKSQPGFVDYPEGFQIHAYQLDRDHWTSGFIID